MSSYNDNLRKKEVEQKLELLLKLQEMLSYVEYDDLHELIENEIYSSKSGDEDDIIDLCSQIASMRFYQE